MSIVLIVTSLIIGNLSAGGHTYVDNGQMTHQTDRRSWSWEFGMLPGTISDELHSTAQLKAVNPGIPAFLLRFNHGI
jgi:hypothetical protein